MTPDTFRRIQDAAGLSDEGLASYLGCSKQQVRRFKVAEGKSSHRPILPETEAKMMRLREEG